MVNKIVQSEAIFQGYLVNSIIVDLNSTGTISFFIGTAATIIGSITWEEITTFGSTVNIAAPNLVTFYKIEGEAGATILTDDLTPGVSIKCVG